METLRVAILPGLPGRDVRGIHSLPMAPSPQRQGLPGELIGHRKDPQLRPLEGLLLNKIQAPDLIRTARFHSTRPRDTPKVFAFLTRRDGKPGSLPQAIDTLVIDRLAFFSQHLMHQAIPAPSVRCRKDL